ncbi:MAG: glycoside hydrolase family 127 protein, partial [Acidobacteria bacterium]|nr:glycoside hydrolase family 127 protein [Acidobacteriota bacterium]
FSGSMKNHNAPFPAIQTKSPRLARRHKTVEPPPTSALHRWASCGTGSNYPFEEFIHLAVTTATPARFPLYLRIPGWCREPQVRINGRALSVKKTSAGFLRIDRQWNTGDRVVLRFPMEPRVAEGSETPYPRIRYFAKSRKISQVTPIDSPWASVTYGPLLFALPIRDRTPNEAEPDARFQFALDVKPGRARREIRVLRRAMPAKWDWNLDSPLQLSARMREFDWRPAELQPLPPAPVIAGAAREVLLVPYGCTRFRVSMFPVTAARRKGARGQAISR